MRAATLTRPPRGVEALTRGRRLAVRGTVSIIPASPRRPTLDELLVGVWEGLRTRSDAVCPVCEGVMRARSQAGHRSLVGCCADCGSTLS